MRKWLEKPYHSLDYMLQDRFKEKVYKITLNGGMSCPNRDGTLGNRGCIFCSAGGSGDFAADPSQSISAQIESQMSLIPKKAPGTEIHCLFSGIHKHLCTGFISAPALF